MACGSWNGKVERRCCSRGQLRRRVRGTRLPVTRWARVKARESGSSAARRKCRTGLQVDHGWQLREASSAKLALRIVPQPALVVLVGERAPTFVLCGVSSVRTRTQLSVHACCPCLCKLCEPPRPTSPSLPLNARSPPPRRVGRSPIFHENHAPPVYRHFIICLQSPDAVVIRPQHHALLSHPGCAQPVHINPPPLARSSWAHIPQRIHCLAVVPCTSGQGSSAGSPGPDTHVRLAF